MNKVKGSVKKVQTTWKSTTNLGKGLLLVLLFVLTVGVVLLLSGDSSDTYLGENSYTIPEVMLGDSELNQENRLFVVNEALKDDFWDQLEEFKSEFEDLDENAGALKNYVTKYQSVYGEIKQTGEYLADLIQKAQNDSQIQTVVIYMMGLDARMSLGETAQEYGHAGWEKTKIQNYINSQYQHYLQILNVKGTVDSLTEEQEKIAYQASVLQLGVGAQQNFYNAVKQNYTVQLTMNPNVFDTLSGQDGVLGIVVGFPEQVIEALEMWEDGVHTDLMVFAESPQELQNVLSDVAEGLARLIRETRDRLENLEDYKEGRGGFFGLSQRDWTEQEEQEYLRLNARIVALLTKLDKVENYATKLQLYEETKRRWEYFQWDDRKKKWIQKAGGDQAMLNFEFDANAKTKLKNLFKNPDYVFKDFELEFPNGGVKVKVFFGIADAGVNFPRTITLGENDFPSRNDVKQALQAIQLEIENEQQDSAMIQTAEPVGGIDLQTDDAELTIQGTLNPAILNQPFPMNPVLFKGMAVESLQILPVPSIHSLLGLADPSPEDSMPEFSREIHFRDDTQEKTLQS